MPTAKVMMRLRGHVKPFLGRDLFNGRHYVGIVQQQFAHAHEHDVL